MDIVAGDKPFYLWKRERFLCGAVLGGKRTGRRQKGSPSWSLSVEAGAEKIRFAGLQPRESLPGLLSQIYMPENREMAGRVHWNFWFFAAAGSGISAGM